MPASTPSPAGLRRRSRRLRVDLRAVCVFVLAFVLVPTLLTLRMLRVHRLSRELLVAVRAPDVQRVRTLLDRGADPNARDMPSRSIGPIEAIRLALLPSARRSIENYRTALMVAIADGQSHTVRALLERGADPNAKAAGGERALLIAARLGAADRVRMLLDRGAQLNARNDAGETALILGCARQDTDGGQEANSSGEVFGGDATARLLLDRGADARWRDITGKGAVSYALERGRYELVPALLDHGGDPDDKDQNGATVVESALDSERYASRRDRAKGLDLLAAALNHGANPNLVHDGTTPVVTAAHENSADALRILLEHRGDPDAVDQAGIPVLIWAIERGEAARALLLLKHGARVDGSHGGRSAIATAVTMRHPDMVARLLRIGATVDGRDAHGVTPLMIAAYDGDADIVRMLLKAGANPAAMDQDGRKVLGYAANRSVAALLQTDRR